MMTLGTIYLIIYYTHEDSFHIMTISSPIVRCPLLLPLGQGWDGATFVGIFVGAFRWSLSLTCWQDAYFGGICGAH